MHRSVGYWLAAALRGFLGTVRVRGVVSGSLEDRERGPDVVLSGSDRVRPFLVCGMCCGEGGRNAVPWSLPY